LCLYCPKSGGIAPAADGGSSCLRCRSSGIVCGLAIGSRGLSIPPPLRNKRRPLATAGRASAAGRVVTSSTLKTSARPTR
jgi:hypothetical protein